MKKTKVIIIGAGPAGVTAGYELVKQSNEFEVMILEESAFIGGISRTVKYKGNRMDIGGHRFFSKDKRVVEWWENIMPLQGSPAFDDKVLHRLKQYSFNGPDPEMQDNVMLKRDRVSRILYNKNFYDYPIKISLNTIKNMGAGRTVCSGFSYLLSVIHKLPETTLENFYINRFGKKLYTMFFEGYTEKVWGRRPSEISADWGRQRVKGLSIKRILTDIISRVFPWMKKEEVETSLIEEFYYPKYGPGQLWEKAAEEFLIHGGGYKNKLQSS